jgi:N-acetylglucosamine-6-phosphate deacetylase
MIGAVGVAPAAAVAMASAGPAAFLGIAARRGRIGPGFAADLVHVDQVSGERIDVLATWIGGVRA